MAKRQEAVDPHAAEQTRPESPSPVSNSGQPRQVGSFPKEQVEHLPIQEAQPTIQPWYESGLLWGAFGTGIAIVLVVVAAMVKDLRWLLWISWPFSCLGIWAMCRNIAQTVRRRTATITCSVIVGAALLWGYISLKGADRPIIQATNICSMSVEATSEIVALLHSRAAILPSGNTEVFKPQFQDLFHDWIIKLIPNGTAFEVSVLIRDQRCPTDQIRVIPPGNSVIIGTKKGWLSGSRD